jgi:NTP pyrophosphatase (non-canonical NTP hydrolase)
MNIAEFQKKCAETVKSIDKKFGIKRDSQLSFCQLMEETGELIKEINKPKLRNKKIDIANLNGEFADVFMQLFTMAEINGVEIEKSVNEKIVELKNRGYLD